MFRSRRDIVLLEARPVGSGAFSHVLRCRALRDNNVYALKVIDLGRLSAPDRRHLPLEIALHSSLDHPHIIRFVDSLQIDARVFLLLENAERGNLFYHLHPLKGLPEHLALRFLYQTALAVKYLHDRDIVHRDIKPENVLLDANYCVKLCDFGWSRQLESAAEQRASICGTFEYMAPEITEQRLHSKKADVWSLGILLYELLRGSPPFSGKSLEEMRTLQRTRPVCYSGQTSAEARQLMMQLLASEEQRRPDVDQLLAHPLFAGRRAEYARELTAEEKQLLEANHRLMCKHVVVEEVDLSANLPFATEAAAGPEQRPAGAQPPRPPTRSTTALPPNGAAQAGGPQAPGGRDPPAAQHSMPERDKKRFSMPELKVKIVSRREIPAADAPKLPTTSSLQVLPDCSDQQTRRTDEFGASMQQLGADPRPVQSHWKRVQSTVLSAARCPARGLPVPPSICELPERAREAGAAPAFSTPNLEPPAPAEPRLPPKLITLLRLTEIVNKASAHFAHRASARPPKSVQASRVEGPFRPRRAFDD